MQTLTDRQRHFAEHYLQHGNAAKAARLAGYAEKSAAKMGSRLLRHPGVQQFLQQTLGALQGEKIATADEVLAFYSSIMRQSVKETQVLTLKREEPVEGGKGARKEETVETVSVPPKIREAMQAAEVLSAVHGIGRAPKGADGAENGVTIIDDVGARGDA